MWKYVPFINLVTLIKIIARNGGLPPRAWPHIIPWLVKTVLLEPLRWIELIVFERKINRHRLQHPPVFILGHYRSGTTYLQRIFMQDDRLGHMSIFQSVLPEVMLCFERLLTPVMQFFCNLFKVRNPFHRIPFTWDFPGEDDVGMIAMLHPNAAQWGNLFPRRMEYYFNKYTIFSNVSDDDKAKWKKEYQYLLKKISLQNKGRRLVLKSPPNTARIKELLEMFPDASFVFIHRDPLDVYASTKKFWQVISKHYILGNNKEDIPKMILAQ
ncbi:MAG TPA: sulfotransferase, partial [Chitinophagaceae bacterium]|nr:sulfotransferase [Chitinophagaceae bacterium]